MIKSYCKLALKVLMRRKFFAFVSMFGISLTLMIVTSIIAFISLRVGPLAPETQREKSLYLDYIVLMKGD